MGAEIRGRSQRRRVRYGRAMLEPDSSRDCAKSLQGEAPCGGAVYGKVDEMSPTPSPRPPSPSSCQPPCPCQPPGVTKDKEDKEELMTLPARDFTLQLP